MKTRNGIYYDLTKSVYKFKVADTSVTFVFSSDLHLTKFEEQYEVHRATFNTKMKSRYRLNINFTVMADLILYTKVETRGFLLINEGGSKICQENLLLCGETILRKT